MKPIVTLALGLAISGAAAFTFAQTAPATAGQGPRHAKMDTNGDGFIDRSEAATNPRMAEQFDKLDTNKDGRISADERPQRGMHDGTGKGGRDAMRQKIQQLDTNKDGRFSRDELAGKERMLRNFTAIDTNKDGFLTHEEMQAFQRAHRGDMGGPRQPK